MEKSDITVFTHPPRLICERITLRRITREDLTDVYEYSRDPLLCKYLLWYPHPDIDYTAKYLNYVDKQYKKNLYYDFGIEYEGKMIGTCGFSSFDLDNDSGEIGYVLSRKFWGQGLAYEAVRRVMKFGFEELRLNRIYARIMVGNEKSEDLAKKCGMRPEGLLKEAVKVKGEYRDIKIYAITKKEYGG